MTDEETIAMLIEARATIIELVHYIRTEVDQPDDTVKGALKTVDGIRQRLRELQKPPNEQLLRTTTDAQVWAQEFVRTVRQGPHREGEWALDEGYMLGWFANAIETTRTLLSKTINIHVDALPKSSLDVLAERMLQIHAKGYSFAHDDKHINGELARGAAWYAWPTDTLLGLLRPPGWVFKPKTTQRANLVIAGALVLAEIDRIDRALTR